MKVFKVTLNYILSIICSLSLLIFFSSIVINTSLLSPSYYYNNFQKNNYYEKLTEDINSKLSYIFLTYNIPQDLSKDIVSSELVKKNVEATVKESVEFFIKKQDSVNLDTNLSEVESKLDDTIEKFLYSNKIIVDTDLKKQITVIKSSFTNIIKNELEIFNLNYIEKSKALSEFRSILSILYNKYYVFLLAAMAVFLTNFIINRKEAVKLSLLMTSILGLAVFMIAFSGYLSGFYNNILISIEYVKAIIITVIKSTFIRFSILGALMFIITFLLYKLVNTKKLK